MRVLHATDIHWLQRPRVRRLSAKRMLGAANLYLAGRHRHFTTAVQDALVRSMLDLAPDVVVITGDLTALALPEEFDTAREALDPVLSSIPTFVQNGNHDVYTRGAYRTDRIAERFGPWLHRTPDGLARMDLPGLTVLGLDPNRPGFAASGRIPDAQLAALPAALADVPEDHAILLAQHYPVVDRHGALYDGWEHGLSNAGDLARVLAESPRVPDAILHGHVHHGYRSTLEAGDLHIPTFNPGSSGYAHLPDEDRAACFNLYTVDGGRLVDVERYRFDGTLFTPEPGGAYATGR